MTQLMKIPIVLWNKQPPSHQITCITVCKNGVIVTGSVEGQLVTWTVHGTRENIQIKAQSMIIAHASSVESIVGVHNTKLEIKSGVVSLASNQEICLWNAETSCCLTNTYLDGRYHTLRSFPSHFSNSIQECLVACFGHQESILVIDSFSLKPVFILKQDMLKCSTSTIRATCFTSFCETNKNETFFALTYDSSLVSWDLPTKIDVTQEYSLNKVAPKYCALSSAISKASVRFVVIQPQIFNLLVLASTKEIFVIKSNTFHVVSRFNLPGPPINDVIFVSPHVLCVFFANSNPQLIILNPVTCDPVRMVPMSTRNQHIFMKHPALLTLEGYKESFIFAATISNAVLMWIVPPGQISKETKEIMCSNGNSIDKIWHNIKPYGISNTLAQSLSFDEGCVSCSLQLQEYGFMIFGLKDGSIAIANTLELLINRMIVNKGSERVSSVILKGHEGSVTCLCHPFEEFTKHNPCHLLSGGTDFSVRLWNIVTGTQLKVYYPHGGFVQDIFVLCGEAIDSSNLNVISVASDFSVAMINLAHEKEILSTRCHTSPVYAVKWRLHDDLLLVYCTDGNLFIWHISTGNLERCVTGRNAVDIFEACNEEEDTGDEDATHYSPTHSTNIVVNMYQTFQPLRPHSVLRDMRTKRGFMGSYRQNSHDMSSKKKVFQKVFRRLSIVKHRDHRTDPLVVKEGVTHVTHTHNNPSSSVMSSHHSSANNLAQQGASLTNIASDDESVVLPLFGSSLVPPFDVIPVRTGHHDADFHIFLIDVDVLVSQLLNEEEYQYLKENISKINFANKKKKQKPPQPPISELNPQSLLDSSADQNNLALLILTLGLCPTSDYRTYLKYCRSVQNYHSTLLLNTARLLISILHPWGLNEDLDVICKDHLELYPSSDTISFGYMSHNKIQLNMPGWTPSDMFFNLKPYSLSKINESSLEHKYVLHWQISSAMTSQHLVVLVILINTFLKLNSFDSDYNVFTIQNPAHNFESQNEITPSPSPTSRQFITASVPDLSKKTKITIIDNKMNYWKSLFKFYIYISDHMKVNQFYQYPLIHELILYWLDYYDEVRRATYNLLITELNRIPQNIRNALVSSWTLYLPNKSEIESTNVENLLILSMDDYIDSGGFYGFWPSNRRYQRTLAVFLISFIVSEFSQEFDPLIKTNSTDISVTQMINLAIIMTKIIKMNINLKSFAYYHVKKALLFLLGRSFRLWQPHLNLSEIISCILDNIAVLRYHLQHLEALNRAKSHKHTVCNNMIMAHRDCLRDILFSHPNVLLHLLNKEMARYTNTGSHILGVGHVVFVSSSYTDIGYFHNPLTSHPNIFNLVSNEISYLLELFSHKNPQTFAQLILEAVDLLINCSAHKFLKKEIDILANFPFLKRFHTIDYCEHSHQLIVGTQSGQLAVYDIRNARCNFITLFKSPVSCIKFSPDKKRLVTFSFDEMCVNVLNTHISILGISTHSFRVELSFPIKKQISVANQQRHLLQIVWNTSNSFSIVFPQSQELTFSI